MRTAELLAARPTCDALPVARAFSHFLNLANIAEQHHRTRRRRAYQRDPRATPQRGSCDEAFPRLIAGGVAALEGPQDAIDEMVQAWDRRRRLMAEGISAIKGLSLPLPEGAFYLFVNCGGLIGRTTPAGRRLDDAA